MTRTDRPGRRFSGRSKQRPYGMLVRQDALELTAAGKSKEPAGRRRYERQTLCAGFDDAHRSAWAALQRLKPPNPVAFYVVAKATTHKALTISSQASLAALRRLRATDRLILAGQK